MDHHRLRAGKTPGRVYAPAPAAVELPVHDASCPFCPGKEGKTPPPILTLPHDKGATGWDVCVVPNKYPRPGVPAMPALAPAVPVKGRICAVTELDITRW